MMPGGNVAQPPKPSNCSLDPSNAAVPMSDPSQDEPPTESWKFVLVVESLKL